MAEYKGILNPVPKNRGGYENYSTTEHEIGTWIDGSKLYEKTISFGALPNTDRKTVSHGISNIGYIVNVVAMAVSSTQTIPLPTANPSAANASISAEATSTEVGIRTGRDFSMYDGYFTLQYTKTV